MSVGSLNLLVWNVADLPVWVNPLYGGMPSKPLEVEAVAQRHRCHAVCVQEAFSLGAWRQTRNPLGYCIFSNDDHCSVLHSGLVSYAQQPPVPGTLRFQSFQSSSAEDSFACKGILGFEMEWQGQRIHIMNVHMQADAIFEKQERSAQTRDRQMEELRRAAREVQARTRADVLVICGDFNQEYDQARQIFERPHWAEEGWHLCPCTLLQGGAFIKTSLDIDFGVAFARSPGCRLTRSILPGTDMSDHSPVVLQLCMPGQA